MHRISFLARSKKVLGAIIIVSSQTVLLHLNTPKKFALYTALLDSTWGWDSCWGRTAADKILLVAQNTWKGDPHRYERWRTNHFTGSFLYPNDITLQIWNVGGVLCDIIIAVCMTYYVCLPHSSLLSLEGNHISFPIWQLSQSDTTFKATKAILKKIIRLSIETGSLTGT